MEPAADETKGISSHSFFIHVGSSFLMTKSLLFLQSRVGEDGG